MNNFRTNCFPIIYILIATCVVCVSCTKSEIPPDEPLLQSPTPKVSETTTKTAPKGSNTQFVRTISPTPHFSPKESSCDQLDYVLGEGDKLVILVTGQNDYKITKEVEIANDGTFLFDFIGEVKATRLTPTSLAEKIKRQLEKDFLVKPEVKISIKEFKSHKVFISGEVNSPGEYLMKKECQLLSEVLMEAGGLKGNFNKNAFITSGSIENQGNPTIKMVDLYQLFLEGKRALDAIIHDKDIIQVYDKGINPLGPQNSIFIFGEVKNQGMYPYSDDLTVLSAILIHAGGFTKAAKKSKVVVKRENNGEVNTLDVNLEAVMAGKKDQDISLKPGDIIHVPRTFF